MAGCQLLLLFCRRFTNWPQAKSLDVQGVKWVLALHTSMFAGTKCELRSRLGRVWGRGDSRAVRWGDPRDDGVVRPGSPTPEQARASV